MPDPKHYETLNKFRSRSLELLRLLHTRHTEQIRSPFQLLVGAGFYLWRSAFMVGAELTDKDSGEAAVNVLVQLLEDNAIAFPGEKRERNWVAGFYLNSAEARVVAAGRRLRIEPGEPAFDAVAQRVQRYMTDTEDEARNPEDLLATRWDDACTAAEWIVNDKLTRNWAPGAQEPTQ